MMHQNPLHDAEQVPEDRVQMNPPSGREPLLRRYRWKDLTEAEKEAVQDCLGIAATRGGVGLGATLTVAALLSSSKCITNSFHGYLIDRKKKKKKD